jgi:hypothetical protein
MFWPLAEGFRIGSNSWWLAPATNYFIILRRGDKGVIICRGINFMLLARTPEKQLLIF